LESEGELANTPYNPSTDSAWKSGQLGQKQILVKLEPGEKRREKRRGDETGR